MSLLLCMAQTTRVFIDVVLTIERIAVAREANGTTPFADDSQALNLSGNFWFICLPS
jgi:hypothetical protein